VITPGGGIVLTMRWRSGVPRVGGTNKGVDQSPERLMLRAVAT